MRRIALPALAVVVVALAFEVAYGVSLGDALLYLGYEARLRRASRLGHLSGSEP